MAGIARQAWIAVVIEGRHGGETIWVFDDPFELRLLLGVGAFEYEKFE